jgi:hypothetical protein
LKRLQLVKRCEEEINQLDRVQNLFPNDQLYLHDKDALSLVSNISFIRFEPVIRWPRPLLLCPLLNCRERGFSPFALVSSNVIGKSRNSSY